MTPDHVALVILGALAAHWLFDALTAGQRLRPLVREYRDETARRARLRAADRAPVGGRVG
jgi:hypothetical protein